MYKMKGLYVNCTQKRMNFNFTCHIPKNMFILIQLYIPIHNYKMPAISPRNDLMMRTFIIKTQDCAWSCLLLEPGLSTNFKKLMR